MNKTREIMFDDSKNIFNDLLEEYDYRMMLAKDEVVSFVLFEMMKDLDVIYNKLSSEANLTRIFLEFKEEEKEVLSEMLVEATYASECIYFKSDDISEEDVESYRCIKVYSVEDKEQFLLYEMIFDVETSYVIIQNINDILVYSISEDYVMDNTFSDLETTAILYTLSFVIGSTIDNKPEKCVEHKVIDLAEYRRKRSTK